MRKLGYAFAFACLCPMALAWGCAPGAGAGSDDGPLRQGVAAWGEATCGTETSWVTVPGNVTSCGQEVTASASPPYGDASCLDGFRREFTGTISTSAVVSATLIDGLNEAECGNASVWLDIYNSSGTDVAGHATNPCTWVGGDSGLNFCNCAASVNWPGGSDLRVVAMAGQGVSCNASKVCTEGTLNSVEVSIQYPPC